MSDHIHHRRSATATERKLYHSRLQTDIQQRISHHSHSLEISSNVCMTKFAEIKQLQFHLIGNLFISNAEFKSTSYRPSLVVHGQIVVQSPGYKNTNIPK